MDLTPQPARLLMAALCTLALQAGCRAPVELAAQTGRQFHVSPRGDDAQDGTAADMLATISEAAHRARPGDEVVVHAGVYRERVTPPRGGDSDLRRIVYRAAPGEKVVIKGSERVRGWAHLAGDTWTVNLDNSLFGEFNPYRDVIQGDWFNPRGRVHHTGAVYLNGHWLTEASGLEEVLLPAGDTPLWIAEAGAEDTTTLWAQFPGVDPNAAEVEINVRQSIFYPDRPGVDYITVRGFTLMHAATPWAPPTAEQIGLLGTLWSRGWIIEQNDISYSTCVGVTLGKYGDRWDNTSENSAEGYVQTIERALEKGWSGKHIGHHVVRNNRISHCEQAGIVGSLGAIFSTISGNEIHDIHTRRAFSGAEMAGIKIHAAIDTEIRGNHIHRTTRGIWLDWMAQGTRVTANLLHDNDDSQDLFVEVNHGPFLVDHNLLLSRGSLLDVSQGGAYAHNLMAGEVSHWPELNRATPYHAAHSTRIAGLSPIQGGDVRFYNNLFVGPSGLSAYDRSALPAWMDGNVFFQGAVPSEQEQDPLVWPACDPGLQITEDGGDVLLTIALDEGWDMGRPRQLVTTELLSRAEIPNLPYERGDGSALSLDTDYLGVQRAEDAPRPGPFELAGGGPWVLRVWPRSAGSRAGLSWCDPSMQPIPTRTR